MTAIKDFLYRLIGCLSALVILIFYPLIMLVYAIFNWREFWANDDGGKWRPYYPKKDR